MASKILKAGHVIKKVFDILDDVFIAAKDIFSPVVGAIAYSSAMVLIYALELIEGTKKFTKALKAYNTDGANAKQPKSKMANGVWASLLSLGGLGLCTAIILNITDVISIPGFIVESVLTPILPGLLGGIYLGNLAFQSYVLHQRKKDEEVAKAAYEADPSKFHEYQNAYQKKVKAEKKVAFAAIELFASMIVITGVTLIGLGVAVAFPPASIIYVGVGLAFGAKLFESFDDRKKGKYTQILRNGFRKFFRLKEDKPQQRSNLPDVKQAPSNEKTVDLGEQSPQKTDMYNSSTTSMMHIIAPEIQRIPSNNNVLSCDHEKEASSQPVVRLSDFPPYSERSDSISDNYSEGNCGYPVAHMYK